MKLICIVCEKEGASLNHSFGTISLCDNCAYQMEKARDISMAALITRVVNLTSDVAYKLGVEEGRRLPRDKKAIMKKLNSLVTEMIEHEESMMKDE